MAVVRGMEGTRRPPRGLVSHQEEEREGEDQDSEEVKIGENLITIVLKVII